MKKGIIRIMVCVFIFSVFFSFCGITYGEENINGNTNCNISNLGYIDEEDNFLYYSNIKDGSKLYKSNLNGEKDVLICEDIPNYINVIGEWIYYSSVNNGFRLYKIKKDGSEKTRLNRDSTHWIKVIGEWIYYGKKGDDGQELYKIKKDGSEKTKIIKDKIYGFIIKDNWIYYSNESQNHNIYKVKLDGTSEVKLNSDESILVDIIGNNIYYQNHNDENKIYKIDINGKNKTKINDDDSQFSNISDGWIYYSNSNDDLKLYKVKIDGSNKEKLSDIGAGEINIVGNYIYYWEAKKDSVNGYKFDSTKLYRVKKDGTSNEIYRIENEKKQDEKDGLSTSTIVITLLIVGTGTFLEVWKLISTYNLKKYVNNLQGEITNEDAKRYISLIKKSRITKRSDIYILLRKGVKLINDSYKVDEKIKKELQNTLLKRGITLNVNKDNNKK